MRKLLWVQWAIIVLFLVLLGFSWAVGAVMYYRAGVNEEEQYYRGLYDVCFNSLIVGEPANRVSARCYVLVLSLKEDNWYNIPSYGWQWPMMVPEGAELPEMPEKEAHR